MNNQEIFDLIDRFERSSLQTMKLSAKDFSLELSRAVAASAAPVAVAPAAAPVPQAQPAAASSLPEITAPLVGTYYAAPAPDQDPFVQVGDKVKKGQTVCLLEAMKMMSEVPAPCDCVIEEILKANGDLAAFGDPLIRYRPC
jgi:acetyl-CoA carboxylase biotin carboxyl carrier protein